MSKRPVGEKKRRRVAKALRRQPLAAHLDLVQYLLDRKHASTKGGARQLILDKRVRSDSHPLGIFTVPTLQKDGKTIKDEDHVDPWIPSDLRGKITVSDAAAS